MDYNTVIDFWFDKKTEPLWFNSTKEFDEKIKSEFLSIYHQAKESQLSEWQQQPLGALALVIILDQFPLNMFRGKAESFATESLSRQVAALAINEGLDSELTLKQKAFLYMPYMHSEEIEDQEQSLILYNQAGLEYNYKFAQHHYDIVRQFGRFPHRNAILGRESSIEEINYMNSDGAFKG